MEKDSTQNELQEAENFIIWKQSIMQLLYPTKWQQIIPFVKKAEGQSTSCRLLFHVFYNSFKFITQNKRHYFLQPDKYIDIHKIPEQLSYKFKNCRCFGIGYKQSQNSEEKYKQQILQLGLEVKWQQQKQQDPNADPNKDHYIIFIKQTNNKYKVLHSFQHFFNLQKWQPRINLEQVYQDFFVQQFYPYEKPKQFTMSYLSKVGVPSEVFVRNYISSEMIKEYFWIE